MLTDELFVPAKIIFPARSAKEYSSGRTEVMVNSSEKGTGKIFMSFCFVSSIPVKDGN